MLLNDILADVPVPNVAMAGIVLTIYVKYVHHKRRLITDDYLSSISNPETVEEAHKISVKFMFQDFPFLASKALEFGLFKTYGIPSISVILYGTGELTQETNKRFDDTDIMIREFMEHNPNSKRSQASVERMNFIHKQYTISNRDYLYVLSIFIVEPIEWTRKFGYRCVDLKEKIALHKRWKDIGEQMGIKNIPKTYDETLEYARAYENKYMKYNVTNEKLAHATMDLLLSKAPLKCLHRTLLHPIIHALCPPLLRNAMGFPEVSPIFQSLIESVLHLHAFLVRHLVLPQNSIVNRTSLTDEEYEATKTTRVKGCDSNNDVCGNRKSKKLFTSFDQFACVYKHGYRIEELGPARFCPVKHKSNGKNLKRQ